MLVIDVVWATNILVSFVTPYVRDVEIIDSFCEISVRYIKGMFLFDVISLVLPFVFQKSHPDIFWIKGLRIFHMSRVISYLIKIVTLLTTYFNMSKQNRNTLTKMVSYFFVIFLLMHALTCVWLYIGNENKYGTWT